MDEKLIICSIVEDDGTGPYGLVQAWSLDSLRDELRRQRRTSVFLPVAAFLADREMALRALNLFTFPAELPLAAFARQFRHTAIVSEAQRGIFTHYSLMGEKAAVLMAVWELAVGLEIRG